MLYEQAGNEGGAGGSGGAGDEGEKNKGGSGDGGSGGQGQGSSDGGNSGSFDLSKMPQEVQDLVKGLRSENAKFRTEKKSLADRLDKMESGFKSIFGDEKDQETPEQKLQNLSASHQALEMKNALLEIAIDNGIAKDQREYFEFLMSKALDSLEDDGELSEEEFEAILSKVKSAGNGGSKGAGNTSVDDKNAGNKNPDGKTGTTLEQFMAMSITQKSKLFSEKPDAYNALLAEAKSKKLI